MLGHTHTFLHLSLSRHLILQAGEEECVRARASVTVCAYVCVHISLVVTECACTYVCTLYFILLTILYHHLYHILHYEDLGGFVATACRVE